MFNLRRVLAFWGRMLRVLIPLYILLFLLVFAAIWVSTILIGVKPFIDLKLGLKVLAGLMPPTLAIVAGFALAISFMRALYGLESYREPFWHLVHCMFGQASFKPWIMVDEAKINTKFNDPESLIVKAGGPGNMVIRKDSAVLLERAGKLTKVEGPGFPHLERFERVHDILDLRPRRWQFAVNGMSKEGIPVTCDTDIVFEIYRGHQKPTEEIPFPMDEHSVFQASTSKWMREKNRPEGQQMLDWRGLIVISQTEGNLRSILAHYPLDRLIAPENRDPTQAQEHPRREIRRQLHEALTAFAHRVGARIIKVELGQIKVEDEVTQQWIETWRASWNYWGVEYLAAADARYAEIVGEAKSEAIARRIRDTANILYNLARRGGPSAFVRGAMIELHLALRNIGSDSLALTYLPAAATKLLQEAIDPRPKP